MNKTRILSISQQNLKTIPWGRIAAESVAIIASILIAFAIDSWWADRQEDLRRDQLILELQIDLAETLEKLDADTAVEEERVNEIENYLRWIDASDSVSVPLEDAKSGLMAAFTTEEFRPTTSTYDSAIASGDIKLITSPDYRRAMSDFVRSQRTLESFDRVYYDGLLNGLNAEVLRKAGDFRILFFEPDELRDSTPIPKRFELNESDLREFYLQQETVAAIVHIRMLKQNQIDLLKRSRTSALEATNALKSESER